MLKDHRPFYIKKAYLKLQALYVKHFIRPHLEHLGTGFNFVKPWNVELFGSPIILGDHVNVIARSDSNVRLTIWSSRNDQKGITVGDYCLLSPGVRISATREVSIGDNCMLANGAYLTDSDWHGVYNRITPGKIAPVRLADNVWIGDSAVVCKGVTIGENSVIGAGSVVVSDVPPNTVAAGNPATVVKQLDPERKITKRAEYFENPVELYEEFDRIDKYLLHKNSTFNWLRTILFPAKGD